jgi:outer membrane receptor protein involved in Fe transport
MQLDLDGSTDGYFAEVKHILKMEKFSVSGGIGYFDGKKDEIEIAAFQPQLPPMFVNSTVIDKRDVDHINFYAYSLINYPEKVTWTVGASYDDFDNKEVDKDLFNPKFGFVWMPVSKTTVRGAAFRTLKRTFISDQTLEPTQVAGFNQFFDDFDGTEAWRYGVGLDHTFSTAVHGGAEISMRDMEVPYTTVGGGSGKTDEEERLARAYMFWTPRNWLALSAEYQFEKIESDPSAPRDDVVELDTHRIPLGINFFHPLGFAVNLKGTYVDQEGDFGNSMSGIVPGEDQFWVFDASIRYRLPKRMGIFRIDAKNIFDEEIKFQDTDPANPWLYPERLIFVKIILSI